MEVGSSRRRLGISTGRTMPRSHGQQIRTLGNGRFNNRHYHHHHTAPNHNTQHHAQPPLPTPTRIRAAWPFTPPPTDHVREHTIPHHTTLDSRTPHENLDTIGFFGPAKAFLVTFHTLIPSARHEDPRPRKPSNHLPPFLINTTRYPRHRIHTQNIPWVPPAATEELGKGGGTLALLLIPSPPRTLSRRSKCFFFLSLPIFLSFFGLVGRRVMGQHGGGGYLISLLHAIPLLLETAVHLYLYHRVI
jgi:hypothetical protein